MLKGVTVTLYRKTKTGDDEFGNPIYTMQSVTVEDVLIAPVSANDVQGTHQADKIVFQLAIPKGDANHWNDRTVTFTLSGETYTGKVVGAPVVGIEENVPTKWHKKVTVECYV